MGKSKFPMPMSVIVNGHLSLIDRANVMQWHQEVAKVSVAAGFPAIFCRAQSRQGHMLTEIAGEFDDVYPHSEAGELPKPIIELCLGCRFN
jgi:hypothetical protein